MNATDTNKEQPKAITWYTTHFCIGHDHKTPSEVTACMIATLANLQVLGVEA